MDPFQYFSREGPYVLPEDAGTMGRSSLLGPDAKANEKLHWCCKVGDYEGVIRCLEKRFAEVNSQGTMLGWT